MKKELIYFWAIFFVSLTTIYAQEITVNGTVFDPYGSTLPGVTILNKQSQVATQTDLNGKYTLKGQTGDTFVFSFLGMKTQEHSIRSTILNITLAEDIVELEGVVVTALGITRDKKSLGYSTQQISGESLAATPVSNFADALHGEIAGLAIKSSGAMGGSSNMIIRGFSSLFGNNQALIVIDGTPINNKTYNTVNQTTGRGGYDYGNAATDINPDDIATLNVLKGAAATALYGSRGQNGVVMITTKKGAHSKQNEIAVEFNSSLMVGKADKQTLPKYQKKYGAGYRPLTAGENANPNNPYFSGEDINGDGLPDYVVQFGEDASYGAAFDPNLMVYQWNAFFPGMKNYGKATPWMGAKNDPNSIWGTSHIYVNSLAVSGSDEKSSFRLGITNNTTDGNLVNSKLKRNSINLSAAHQINDKLKASGNITYTNTTGKGRVGTGYDGLNPMQSFRQWWQTSVDMEEQKEAYFATNKSNASWNINSIDDNTPLYTDNYYFTRYQNYQTDSRDRYIGNIDFNYSVTPWLNLIARYTFDNYDETREGRLAIGTSGSFGEYKLFKQSVSENNYDMMAHIKKDINDNITFDANLGWNLRVEKIDRFEGTTNGGLQIPGLYTLANSTNALTANNLIQYRGTKKVDGLYARASLGFYNMIYLDGSIRTDRSSTLSSESQNRYWYPSVSGSFIFSEILNSSFINFGKFRANYAQVGNDTDLFNLYNTYTLNAPFDDSGSAQNPATFLNKNLRPEMMSEYEFGIEMAGWNNRISLELSYYNRTTKDLITPVDVSSGAGATSVWMNAGDMVNKGVEANLNITPVKTTDFNWKIGLNFAKNKNEVLELAEGVDYLQLASLQGGISIGAQKGEAYGVLRGTGFKYNDNGDRLVGENGQYLHSPSNTVIGNMNPDWVGGIKNTFSYKNLSLSFLIDMQKGGNVFSLDTYYGYATGLYDNYTSGLNDLGNPVRNTLANGGGVILNGVKEDGTPNDIRVRADQGDGANNPWGYLSNTAPSQAHVYDASYVKLRNVTLSYDLPEKMIRSAYIKKLTIAAIGRNLWIIHKKLPYSDPEAGLSAGNIQGYQSGAHPTIREIGASIKVQF